MATLQILATTMVYWGNIGMMENKMEATIMGYIGIKGLRRLMAPLRTRHLPRGGSAPGAILQADFLVILGLYGGLWKRKWKL